MPGTRFGDLTVLRAARPLWAGDGYRQQVRVRCVCGTESIVKSSRLRGGRIGSCGCANRRKYEAMWPLPGTRFGKWTLERVLGSRIRWGQSKVFCRVRCDCGTVGQVLLGKLRARDTRSCRGCLRRPAPTREAVLAEVRRIQGRSPRPLLADDLPSGLSRDIMILFGAIAACRAEAGLPQGRQPWSRRRIVDELRRLADAGVSTTANVLRAEGHASLVSAAYKHCGTFRRATALAFVER